MNGCLHRKEITNFWPHAPEDDPIAQKLNSVPKYVVSTTLDKVEWNNSTLIKGNVAEEVAKLKQQPGSGIVIFTYQPANRKEISK